MRSWLERFVGVVASAVALTTQVTAFAHHSFAMFDMQKTITVEGTVKDYQWTNPHVWIDLIVIDPATHQDAAYSVEGGAIIILSHNGWARDSVKPGDKVSLVVHPLKQGTGGSLVSGSANGKPIGHGIQP
jgi:hypothetical protein